MRKATWGLLILFVFAIPWEYSLDMGAPLGNVARLLGLAALPAAVLALLQAGRMRKPGTVHWLVFGLFFWFCCTYFWTRDPDTTLVRLRGFFQEMMVVWLVWEFAEDTADLHVLLRAWLAGSWVLALLTFADAGLSLGAVGQFRFAAVGQDPNDVARFLSLGFPIAALVYDGEKRRLGRWMALGYFPAGMAGVLLTGSRGGFLGAMAGIAGGGLLLARDHRRAALTAAMALPVVGGALWLVTPHETLGRLETIAGEFQRGDWNQRLNIWAAGWRSFTQAPLMGHGMGTFVNAAGLAQGDTAHNTVLSIAVEGGLCGLFVAVAIVVASARIVLTMKGSIRMGLGTLLAVWGVLSLAGTEEGDRTTWLMFAVIALAGRLAEEASGVAVELHKARRAALQSTLADGVT